MVDHLAGKCLGSEVEHVSESWYRSEKCLLRLARPVLVLDLGIVGFLGC